MVIKEQIINSDGISFVEREMTEDEINSINENQKQERIEQIQTELTNLSQDFIQAELGAVFEDLDERKDRFRTLHNELRELLGKSPRNYLTLGEINDNTMSEGE